MSRTAARRSSFPRQNRHRIIAMLTCAVVWLAILDGTAGATPVSLLHDMGLQTSFAMFENSSDGKGSAAILTTTEPNSLVLLGSGLLVFCFAQAVRRRIRKGQR